MGQKVHPKGIRLGISADWQANWYAAPKHYAKKVRIDLLARAYLARALQPAGVSAIFTAFTTKRSTISSDAVTQESANITVRVGRPGLVIGKKGGGVDKMKKTLEAMIEMPVYLAIKEVKKPELDAKLVSENIAYQLVRRINHRRAIKKAQDIAMSMGALGIKVIVSGRLGGTEIAKRETYQKGSVPLHTFSKVIDYAQATAQTSSGKVGLIVYIHTKPNAQTEVEEKRTELNLRRARQRAYKTDKRARNS